MTEVTVSLEDLETIVFATGVIKTIEGALASHKRDPFVQPHLDFTATHDRLASAMRNATRAQAGTLVVWDEPLTEVEARALRYVAAACDERKPGLGVFVISPEDKAALGEAMGVYDKLEAKGCLRMGQFIEGVMWAGAAAPAIKPDPKGYAAQLTPRGRDKLAVLPPLPKKNK
jgi:hypothetical protein